MFNVQQIKEALRNPYAWPGGYTTRLYMMDGECLCRSCALANLPELFRAAIAGDKRDSWAVTAHDVHWEVPAEYCAQCGGILPSEYGDPNRPDNDDTRDPDGEDSDDDDDCRWPNEAPEDDEEEAPTVYPWPSEVYPATPYGDYGSLPAFTVTRSPGGRRARWVDYNAGIGMNEELSALNRGLRTDKEADPADIARQVADARAARLAAMRDEWSAGYR